MAQVRRSGQQAAALTRQLLAFSRQQITAPKALDLNVVIGNLEKMLRRVIGEDIELVIALQTDLQAVKADPNQVEQLVLNLAVNARDAMPGGGRLTIETENVEAGGLAGHARAPSRPGRWVRLVVSDTGVGMSEAVKARIFEPFFTTKEMGKGTGLGLATVYGVVEQSGGYIDVKSAPGCGTTFQVCLPATAEVCQAQPEPDDKADPRGSETVLLVEDENAVRSLTGRILRGCGYAVLEAAHPAEAVALCEQYPEVIHLLVSDVVMPGLGGRELAERLCRLRPEMKTLFMSGYTDDTVVRLGVQAAEVNFLQKPFLPVELTRKVRKVLDGG
jgi:CheY-like chemotaxis protein